MFMNRDPRKLPITLWSLNSLRNCTCGSRSDPYAAEAIIHLRDVVTVSCVVVAVNVVVVVVDVVE
jgi:hypothetical protein